MSDENANNDPLSSALGITPIQKTMDSVSSIIADAQDDSALKDFESARANIHTMIDTAQGAIEKLSQIADSSQHPRAFEVLSKLIDSTVAANKSLLDLQEKIKQLKEADAPINGPGKTINNNLFVGSTAELNKLLKGNKE